MGALKREIIGAPPWTIKNPYKGLFSKWGSFFFFIEALFRLDHLIKISVGVHCREQTRCRYCNKANTNTWCIKCNVRLSFTETRNCYIALPYHIIIDVLNEDLLNDINNISFNMLFSICTHKFHI